MEQSYKTRIRINYAMSVKGICTANTTFEGYDMTRDQCIAQAALLFATASDHADKMSK